MHEVHNLLLNCPGMDKSLGARLLNHLLKALPQISGESGTTGSAGTTSPLPLPTSPTQSPLALPSFQPRPLHLHTPPSPVSPPSPSSPHCSPGILLQREGAGMRPSPPRSPSPQPLAPSALPPAFPGGDPSMWRPWWRSETLYHCSLALSPLLPLFPNSVHYILISWDVWVLGLFTLRAERSPNNSRSSSPWGFCGIVWSTILYAWFTTVWACLEIWKTKENQHQGCSLRIEQMRKRIVASLLDGTVILLNQEAMNFA